MIFDVAKAKLYNDGVARAKKGMPLRADEYLALLGYLEGDSMPEERMRLRDKLIAVQLKAITDKIVASNRPSSAVLEAWEVLDKAAHDAWIKDKPLRSRALSGADRVARHVAKRADIGELPEVVDCDRREAAKNDLLFFGVTYCRGLLLHDPSDKMVSFIRSLESGIKLGGLVHVMWPRGKGKTTWVKIAILWALIFGYRSYIVVFAKNSGNAENIVDDVWDMLETEEVLHEDFPEFTVPARCLEGITQRCKNQCYMGRRTRIMKKTNAFRLAVLDGFEHGGGRLVARGWKAGSRGLVSKKYRPDFVFLDDLQDREDSESTKTVAKMEAFIAGDALGLAGHDRSIAAYMASTPISPDDISERFSSETMHPEWITHAVKMVGCMPDEEMLEAYRDEYIRDKANRDEMMSLSRRFYLSHKSAFAGMDVMDPLDGDPDTEVDAIHHCLNLYCKMGRKAFFAEYQMRPESESEVLQISVDDVALKINRYAWCAVPPVCRSVVVYCDCNDVDGFRWGALAVGNGDITAVLAYGRYPKSGRLYPENSTEQAIEAAVATGMRMVVEGVQHLPILREGERVPISALCFDGGWKTATIARVIPTLKAGFPVIWSKGFGWKQYRTHNERGELRPKVVALGNHAHISSSGNGKFLAVQSDYWREVMQRSFLVPPLTRGSCSFWGTDKTLHYGFAQEVVNEKLVDKGDETWRWSKVGKNHWGDVAAGCFAVAGWYRFLDPVTTGLRSVGIRRGKADGKADSKARQAGGYGQVVRKGGAMRRVLRPRFVKKRG